MHYSHSSTKASASYHRSYLEFIREIIKQLLFYHFRGLSRHVCVFFRGCFHHRRTENETLTTWIFASKLKPAAPLLVFYAFRNDLVCVFVNLHQMRLLRALLLVRSHTLSSCSDSQYEVIRKCHGVCLPVDGLKWMERPPLPSEGEEFICRSCRRVGQGQGAPGRGPGQSLLWCFEVKLHFHFLLRRAKSNGTLHFKPWPELRWRSNGSHLQLSLHYMLMELLCGSPPGSGRTQLDTSAS